MPGASSSSMDPQDTDVEWAEDPDSSDGEPSEAESDVCDGLQQVQSLRGGLKGSDKAKPFEQIVSNVFDALQIQPLGGDLDVRLVQLDEVIATCSSHGFSFPAPGFSARALYQALRPAWSKAKEHAQSQTTAKQSASAPVAAGGASASTAEAPAPAGTA